MIRNEPFRIQRVSAALLAIAYCSLPQAVGAVESPYLDELPTVLTVSRLPQPVNEAPGAVTVISGDLLRATGYRDLARVFRLVPGMQVGQERGHWYWVTYHGLGNNFPSELQVLIDGRSVFSPSAFGGVDWAAIPLSVEEIERIEIVRGPNAVTYGANAFLGVINIITRHSAGQMPAYARTNVGEPGIFDVHAGGSLSGNGVAIRGNASLIRDEGFRDMHDSRRVTMGSMRADYRFSNADEVMVRLAASEARKGEGYPDSVFNNNGLRDSRNSFNVLHLTWTHAPQPDNELTVHYYRNQEKVVDEWTSFAMLPTAPPTTVFVPLNRNRESVRDHLELQHRFFPTEDTQFVWGAEARQDRIDSPFLYASTGGSETVRLYRFFANGEWRIKPSLRASAGAAVERYAGEAIRLAPRAFLNWQASPRHAWRMGASRAYQQHPTFEKYGDVQAIDSASGTLLVRPYRPNPDLRQSRIDSVELGYVGQLGGNTSLDVRLFDERVRDYIIRVPSDYGGPLLESQIGSAIYVNREHAVQLRGLEYQVKLRPWTGAQWLLSHAMIDRNSGDAATDDRVAPYSASVTWMQDYGGGWRSLVSAIRMGPLAGGDGFLPLTNYVATAYTTYDFRISYTKRFGKRDAEFALSGINLGPRHQEIPDRSQQAIFGTAPANPVSKMIWLSFRLAM